MPEKLFPQFCKRGVACNCAHHNLRQRLFYETVNLPPSSLLQVAAFIDEGYVGASWVNPAYLCFVAQQAGKLADLWDGVQAFGGDLQGHAPRF